MHLCGVGGTQCWCMLDNSRTEYGEALELGECFECRTAPDARIIIGNGAKIGNRSRSISIIPATCSVLVFESVFTHQCLLS